MTVNYNAPSLPFFSPNRKKRSEEGIAVNKWGRQDVPEVNEGIREENHVREAGVAAFLSFWGGRTSTEVPSKTEL